jgi:superfamily II DNA or RNA helicase
MFERPQDETYPTVTRHVVRIPMSQKYFAEYQRVENQNITSYQAEVLGESNLEPFYNGVRRAVNADIEELNSKLDWVRRHLLEFNNRKMVIFSPFISLGVRQLEKLVKDFDTIPKIAEITGADSTAQRQKVIDDYNKDEIQILLISIGAGGLGINLKGTRDVVLMQPGWNEVEMAQAEGRAIRFQSHTHLPPNERHVDVWQLLLVKPIVSIKPAVDEIILGIIARKNAVLEPFMERLREVSIERLPC